MFGVDKYENDRIKCPATSWFDQCVSGKLVLCTVTSGLTGCLISYPVWCSVAIVPFVSAVRHGTKTRIAAYDVVTLFLCENPSTLRYVISYFYILGN